MHKTAVLRLSEAQKRSEVQSFTRTRSFIVLNFVTVMWSFWYTRANNYIPRYTQVKCSTPGSTYTKKFQLAHFIAAQGKPFKLHEDFAKFESDILNVDPGSSYISDTLAAEIVRYLMWLNTKQFA